MNRVSVFAGLVLSANTVVQLLGAEPQAAPYKVAAGPYVVETVNEVVLHARGPKERPAGVCQLSDGATAVSGHRFLSLCDGVRRHGFPDCAALD